MSELSDFAQKIGGMSSQPADLFIKFKIFYRADKLQLCRSAGIGGIMEYDFLLKHKFEFISYYYGYFSHYLKLTNGQINSDSLLTHIAMGTGRLLINSQKFLVKEGAVISRSCPVLS